MKKRFSVAIILRLCCLSSCAFVLFSLAFCFAWAQGFIGTQSADALNAAIHPLQSISAIAQYIEWGGKYFNIPILAICVWVAWVLAITGNGIIIAHQLLPAKTNPFELLFFGFACGFIDYGLMILLLFAIGFSGAKVFGTLLAIQLIFTVATGSFLYERLYRRNWRQLKSMVSIPKDWPAKLLLICTAIIIIIGFLYCLTPPIQSDAMRYHLTAPQEFLKSNSLEFIPLNAFAQFPLLLQMHYSLALALGVPEAAQLMHWTCMLVTALAIATFVHRFVCKADKPLRKSLPILAFALYIASPAVFIVGCWPFTDQATVMFLVLSCYGLVTLEHSLFPAFIVVHQNKLSLLLKQQPMVNTNLYSGIEHFRLGSIACITGIMMGGAIGTKYTAIPFLMAAVIIFVANSLVIRRNRIAVNLLRSVIPTMIIASLGTGVWWYLRNLFQTGNPVYPLLNSFFLGGGDWTHANAVFYAERMASKGEPKTLTYLLTAPWDCSFNWLSYEAHYPGVVFIIIFATAILAAIFLTFSFIVIHKERHNSVHKYRHLFLIPNFIQTSSLLFFFLMGLCWWIMWFFSYQSNRMSTVTYALFIPPAMMIIALATEHMKRQFSLLLTWGILLAIIYSMAWTVQWITVGARPIPATQYLFGSINKDEYMTRSLSYWQAFSYLNERTDENSKVFIIGDHRLYGAKFKAYWSDWFNTPAPAHYIRTNKITTTQELLKQLRSDRFDWVFVNDVEWKLQGDTYTDRLTSAELQMITQLPDYAKNNGAKVIPIQNKTRLIKLNDAQTSASEIVK